MPLGHLWRGVAALIAVLALFAPLTARAQPARPTRTVIHYVSPWGVIQSKPLVDTVDGGEARCDTLSFLREYRADAFRCFYGDIRTDSCFVRGTTEADGSRQLICLTNPFDSTPVLVQSDLTDVAPWTGSTDDAPPPFPWALKLADGTRCGVAIGFMPSVAGQRVNSICDDGGHLFGSIDRSQALWQVNHLAPDALISNAVDVFDVWY